MIQFSPYRQVEPGAGPFSSSALGSLTGYVVSKLARCCLRVDSIQ
jgi:hypothetical protein